MKIYKTRVFNEWAKEEGLSDQAISNVIVEIKKGLKGSALGGALYKKRVAIEGRGKRGGKRVIIAFIENKKLFFVYGFSKNETDNIDEKQEKALKKMAKQLFSYTEKEVSHAVKERKLFEVKKYEERQKQATK